MFATAASRHLRRVLDEINQQLQRYIDEVTDPWGVKVSLVEVKDVNLPTAMERSMASQAEAERDRRARCSGSWTRPAPLTNPGPGTGSRSMRGRASG